MFDRVLILSVDIGGGHVRAAQAVEKAFHRLDAAREVRIADALQYTSKFFYRFFERTERITGKSPYDVQVFPQQTAALTSATLIPFRIASAVIISFTLPTTSRCMAATPACAGRRAS